MTIIKNIIFYLFISLVLNLLSKFVDSHFFAEFLKENLVLLVVTLLAINTATCGLVIANIREIAKGKEEYFRKTFNEIKKSIVEQIFLIGISVLLLILADSSIIKNELSQHDLIFNTLLGAVFVYSMDILYDTGMAIFKMLEKP